MSGARLVRHVSVSYPMIYAIKTTPAAADQWSLPAWSPCSTDHLTPNLDIQPTLGMEIVPWRHVSRLKSVMDHPSLK